MHSISVNVTPPRPRSSQSSLTPSAFLLSSEMIQILDSKNIAITQDEQATLLLDPKHTPSDNSISSYHQRVSKLLPEDRTKLTVLIPMNKCMGRLEALIADQAHYDQLKFQIYTSDLMIGFVEKLESLLGKKKVHKKGMNDPDSDRKVRMSRAKDVLDNISPQAFTKKTGLDPSFRKTIPAFAEITEKRNSTVHETGCEFARLLLTEQFQDPAMAQQWNCPHWSTLLLWVTGYSTLEEMAAVANNVVPPPIQ